MKAKNHVPVRSVDIGTSAHVGNMNLHSKNSCSEKDAETATLAQGSPALLTKESVGEMAVQAIKDKREGRTTRFPE